MIYLDSITYHSVKTPLTLFNEGPLGIVPSKSGSEKNKGMFYNGDLVTEVNPFINAIDIDWNKAEVSPSTILNTTTDLLKWIKNSSIQSAGLKEIDLDLKNLTPSEEDTIIYKKGKWRYKTLEALLTNIKYSDLNILRYSSELEPGKQYRITDYQPTLKSGVDRIGISIAKNQLFDIIVTANSKNTFDENARVIHHSGDTHFLSNNLNAWEIKYKFYGGSSEFDWKPASGGKGVIYYMKDEFGNECPYDFKNILFNGKYTFNVVGVNQTTSSSGSSSSSDSSGSYNIDASLFPECHSNKIKPYYENGKQILNFITINSKCSDIIIDGHHIIFKGNNNNHVLVEGQYLEIKNNCNNIIITNEVNTNDSYLTINNIIKYKSFWTIIGKDSNDELKEINIFDLENQEINLEDINLRISDLESRIANLLDISELQGETISFDKGNINNLNSKNILTENLEVSDILNTNLLLASNITTDYLTVNKSANFFELVTDKVRSIQGTQIISATSCGIDFIEPIYENIEEQGHIVLTENIDAFKVYWRNTDSENNEITNDWLPLDLAVCQTFNSYINKFYWRKVLSVDEGNKKLVCIDRGIVQNAEFDTRMIRTFRDVLYKYNIIEDGNDWTPDSYEVFDNFRMEVLGATQSENNSIIINSTTDTIIFIPLETMPLNGVFTFTVSEASKCGIRVYYYDGTSTYKAPGDYLVEHSISILGNKHVAKIVINFGTIDRWDLCNWMILSNKVFEQAPISPLYSYVPTIGDNLCLLGYRYNELSDFDNLPIAEQNRAKARASAIIISANSIRSENLTPPFYAHYLDITNFSLYPHRKSYMDATGAHIVGDFEVIASGHTFSLDEYIESKTSSQEVELIVKNGETAVDLCVMLVDESGKIHDLNNFPGLEDSNLRRHLSLLIFSTLQSIDIEFIECTIFGQTIRLLEKDPNTEEVGLPSITNRPNVDGIYIHEISYNSETRTLDLTFDFLGTEQVISNGSHINFYGEVTVNNTLYKPSKSITIATVSSIEGTDAEIWKLNKEIEYANINSETDFNCYLKYNLLHIVGITGNIVSPTTLKLIVEQYSEDGIIESETIYATNGYFEYRCTKENLYENNSDIPIYLIVKLQSSNDELLDSSIVNIINDPITIFTIKLGLIEAIQRESQERETKFTTLSNTVDGINTKVGHVENIIGNESDDGTILYNVSLIKQTASDIESRVNQHSGNINDLYNKYSSIKQTAENIDLSIITEGLNLTGINILDKKITLNSSNTVIEGDLNLHGNFTSENISANNKAIIDAKEGGIKLFGPKSADPNEKEQLLITDIGFGSDPDSNRKYGYATFYDAFNHNNLTVIDNESLNIKRGQNSINIDPNSISYNQESLEMSQLVLRKLRVAKPSNEWYDASLRDDMIISNYDGEITINFPDTQNSEGKFYFIKHKKNYGTNIRCVDAENRHENVIMNDNSTNTDWTLNIQDNSTLFFCDGEHWIMMELDF